MDKIKTFALKYILIFALLFCISCKKKTSIEVNVHNYALAEPIANAKVVLVERHIGGIFGATADCKEIASAVTDEAGNCSFDKEKLKNSKSYDYYLAITEAYGMPQSYPCGGKTSGFIKVGESQKNQLQINYFEAFIKVQFSNLFNPAMAGDSLFFQVLNPQYQIPGRPFPEGGGGILNGYYYFNGVARDSILTSNVEPTSAGKNTIHIRKRKMGVVTEFVDTVRILPNETGLINVNW